jgi:hypothetical protein
VALVELDLFSGRPNPTWDLDHRSAQQLQQLIESLPPTHLPPPEPPGLGYRGFRVSVGDRSYWVWGSHVVVAPGDHRQDLDRKAETFLLDHLPAEHSDLRELVGTRARRSGCSRRGSGR